MSPRSTSDGAPPVVRLHPIRSLVLGADPAYRDRVIAVIGELGPVAFALAALWECDEVADVLALVSAERPDVVVLDATGCEAAAERIVGALADAAPRVGAVLVCERSTPTARRLGALPKWGWTQDLHNAVEAACAASRHRGPGRKAAPPPRIAGPLSGWDESVPAPKEP